MAVRSRNSSTVSSSPYIFFSLTTPLHSLDFAFLLQFPLPPDSPTQIKRQSLLPLQSPFCPCRYPARFAVGLLVDFGLSAQLIIVLSCLSLCLFNPRRLPHVFLRSSLSLSQSRPSPYFPKGHTTLSRIYVLIPSSDLGCCWLVGWLMCVYALPLPVCR